MAVGHEGAHAPWLGERQRLTVLGLAALGVEPVGMGRDVAEQVQRMRREAGVTRRGCERAVAQALRLVEPTEEETGATQLVAGPGHIADVSSRGIPLKQLLALPEPARGLARLAELCQHPGGDGDREGQDEHDVPGPGHGDGVLER